MTYRLMESVSSSFSFGFLHMCVTVDGMEQDRTELIDGVVGCAV